MAFINTEYARRYFPDCLAKTSTARSDYLELLRKCKIAITTTGLVDSIPAKLAEYIAATRCILTDPLLYELPYEINDREHVMIFNNPDEGIKAAEQLLDDDELANDMRRNNVTDQTRPLFTSWTNPVTFS